MQSYFGAIWSCRFFWLSLVKMDLRSRYRGSALGIFWSLLHPLAMTVILCVVFSFAFGQDLRIYAPLVFTGLTFWGFFGAVLVGGCGCFFQGESYIRQFPAPMAIYPLRTVLGAAFHFLIGMLLAITIGLLVGPDTSSNEAATRLNQLLALPSLVPSCILLLLFGWSISTLSGLFSVRFRDTKHMAEIGLQGLFYLTPIMYRIETFKDKHRLMALLQCNPLVSFLDLIRDPILLGQFPSLTTYATAGAVVLVLASAATLAMWIEERRLIFHL
jgi:lipopolysaccharide transport system permease protein